MTARLCIAAATVFATLQVGVPTAWGDSWGVDLQRTAGSVARPDDRAGIRGVGATTAVQSLSAADLMARDPERSLDRRSPDTRDAVAARLVDLRSPDTRDASTSRPVVVVGSASPSINSIRNRGFDWDDAGIGAIIGIALVGATVLLLGHIRGRHAIPTV